MVFIAFGHSVRWLCLSPLNCSPRFIIWLIIEISLPYSPLTFRIASFRFVSYRYVPSSLLFPISLKAFAFAVVGNNWCIISFPENVALGHRTHKSHSLSLQECRNSICVVSQQCEIVCVPLSFFFSFFSFFFFCFPILLIIIISYKRGDSSISYKGAIINGRCYAIDKANYSWLPYLFLGYRERSIYSRND